MAVLKKYNRNCSRLEGCIAMGCATNEVIEFYVDFIDDFSPIGVPMSRHEGSDRNRVPTVAAKVVGVRGWRARPWGSPANGRHGDQQGERRRRGRARAREWEIARERDARVGAAP